jgi:hypothetical protein
MRKGKVHRISFFSTESEKHFPFYIFKFAFLSADFLSNPYRYAKQEIKGNSLSSLIQVIGSENAGGLIVLPEVDASKVLSELSHRNFKLLLFSYTAFQK